VPSLLEKFGVATAALPGVTTKPLNTLLIGLTPPCGIFARQRRQISRHRINGELSWSWQAPTKRCLKEEINMAAPSVAAQGTALELCNKNNTLM